MELGWLHGASSSMKTGIGVQALLRVRLRNLRIFSVGITDRRDVRCTTLRWLHVV
jgi:hypothetical protein